MTNRITNLMAVLTLFVWAGTANADLITFEEFGTQYCCFASQEPLDTEYSSLGVNFSGGWEILNQSGGFGISARSGEHFAAYNTSVPGITNTLSMAFDNTLNQAEGFLGDGSQSNWTVTALLNGSLVSQLNLTNLAGSYVQFSFIGLAFNQIDIQGFNNAAVLDDLSFGVAQVPEPSALILIGLGLAGLVVSRRKKV